MKKTILFGMCGVMLATTANAGLFDGLFGKKEAEPQTLEEACNKDEITAICPEILLGTKTIQECMIENVSSVSKKCAKFVKKSVTDKADSVKQQVADVKDGVATVKAAKKQELAEKKAARKQELAEKKAAAKAVKAELKSSLKETKAAAKAALEAERKQLADSVAANAE